MDRTFPGSPGGSLGDVPATWAILLSASIGAIYAAVLLGLPFIEGAGAFWSAPAGIMGGAGQDMQAALIGYQYYLHDVWRWPITYVPDLGAPEGTNIALVDGIPWLSLVGKALYRTTGLFIMPFGAWVASMFVANGVAMTMLLRAVGQRGLVAISAGTAFGLLVPALHYRFGHLALLAHCLIVGSLAIYFQRVRGSAQPFRGEAAQQALCFVALLTNIYLYAMCFPIYVAAAAQELRAERVAWQNALGRLASLLLLSAGLMWLLGIIGSRSVPLPQGGFGAWSMNLLSPAWPQLSGLFAGVPVPLLTRGLVLGTSDQYEGYNYLGAGILLLLAVGAITSRHEIRKLAWRHWPLVAALVGCTLFALSNRVYLGHWQILAIPLPHWIEQPFSQFRSSGRFFWPPMYALVLVAIASALSRFGLPVAACLISVAAALQFADLSLLRDRVMAAVSSPHGIAADALSFEDALAHEERVVIYPSWPCLDGSDAAAKSTAMTVQLMASRLLMPINSVYAARSGNDCAAERRPTRLEADTFYLLLGASTHDDLASRFGDGRCAAVRAGAVCSASPTFPGRRRAG